MTARGIELMNLRGQWVLTKKRRLFENQSHVGLHHYHKQDYKTTQHVGGHEKQWTSYQEVANDKIEGKEKLTETTNNNVHP